VYHYARFKPDARSFWLPNLFAHGYIAVDFFFVMSGFVLALTHGNAFAGRVTFGLIGSFLRRRLARIYPLYAFLCAANVVAMPFLARESITRFFPLIAFANFAMIQSWLGMMSFEGPMWSISAEWAAYLGFPLFIRWTFGLRSAAALTLGVCVATLFALTIFPAWSDPQELRDGRPLNILHEPSALLARCFAEFVIGILVFRISRTPVAVRLASGAGAAGVVVAAIVVALLAIRSSDVFVVLAFAVLVIVLSRDRGPVARALAFPVVHSLGIWSYAIYLIAPIVEKQMLPGCIAIAAHVVPDRLAVPVGITLSIVPLIAFSYLAHRLVEVPGRRLFAGGRAHAPTASRLLAAEA
jgi:peptidoglycan/LPS O-acetylase OafA/YrhL